MKSRIVLAAAVALAALAFGAGARADYIVGTLDGRCDYRCCDTHNNCNVYYFYHGTGVGAESTPCTWEAVCENPGSIGWGAGPYPQSKARSSLTYTKGCWHEWETDRQGHYEKRC